MIQKRKLVGITSPHYSNRLRRENRTLNTEAQKFIMRRQNFGKEEEPFYSDNPDNIGNKMDELKDEETFDITQFHSCDESLYWTGCYSSDTHFKKFIHPDTFAHPAKMSMLLCDKIIKHLKKLGFLKEGDKIMDFMSGTGRTGIMASLHGHDFIGIELEKHFCDMSKQNLAQLKKAGQFCICED